MKQEAADVLILLRSDKKNYPQSSMNFFILHFVFADEPRMHQSSLQQYLFVLQVYQFQSLAVGKARS